MLHFPMDVLTQFPVRKSREEKRRFRVAVQAYAESLGYHCTIERKSLSCQNLVIGDPEQAAYLVTAHYDTCARLPFPNFITPCNIPLYLLFQAGKWGLIALISVVFSSLAGLLFGQWCIAPMAVLVVFGLIALILMGPANVQNANDNTSGVITLLEILRTLPENQRGKVCFVLFDLEEIGLMGSSFYLSQHRKACETQIVLNLDCVGDGDHLMMFPTKQLRKDRKKLTSLYKACGYFGKKSLLVYEKGSSIYPSDQMNFKYGVGICAVQKKKKTFYISRIHTKKDTVLDQTNVNILRAALTTFICCDEVNLERK